MNKLLFIYFFLITFFSTETWSQNSKINYDSLLNIWEDSTVLDSVRYSSLFSLIINMTYEYPDSCFHYIDVMDKEADEKQHKRYTIINNNLLLTSRFLL